MRGQRAERRSAGRSRAACPPVRERGVRADALQHTRGAQGGSDARCEASKVRFGVRGVRFWVGAPWAAGLWGWGGGIQRGVALEGLELVQQVEEPRSRRQDQGGHMPQRLLADAHARQQPSPLPPCRRLPTTHGACSSSVACIARRLCFRRQSAAPACRTGTPAVSAQHSRTLNSTDHRYNAGANRPAAGSEGGRGAGRGGAGPGAGGGCARLGAASPASRPPRPRAAQYPEAPGIPGGKPGICAQTAP